METKAYVLHFIIATFLTSSVKTATLSEYDTLYTSIFQNYNKKILPVVNVGEVVYINMDANLISINDFDGLTGELSITLVFNISWVEKRVSWTPTDYNNVSSVVVSSEDIWHPTITIRESAKNIIVIGKDAMLMRLSFDGKIVWTTGAVFVTTCSMDVTYFPFDMQSCEISLGYSTYYTTESVLTVSSQELGTTIYIKNSQWHLIGSSTRNSTYHASFVTIILKLGRRSEFFVVYILIPIISLGVLNTTVFMISATSGERISVVMTTLLSFVVYMQLINNIVPENSEPMAYIFYYLTFLVVFSAVTMIMCILSTKLYDASDGDVPYHVRNIVWYLNFRCVLTSRRLSVHPDIQSQSDEADSPTAQYKKSEKMSNSTELRSTNMTDITWTMVGQTFDRYCFVTLNAIFLVYTTVVISNLRNNGYNKQTS